MHKFQFDSNKFSIIKSEIEQYRLSLSEDSFKMYCINIFHCMDHTTLHDEDNAVNVNNFCHKAINVCSDIAVGSMASICVYPEYASLVKQVVSNAGVKVAAVAGGFPTGQMPLAIKLQEVSYAVQNGADEVDFVINRGRFLEFGEEALAEEIAAVRNLCGNGMLLKVILETGQLMDYQLIYSASMTAMENGADFIKTSTGKISVGATPEAAFVMLSAISDFCKKTGRKVGFKVSGGVSTVSDALFYYFMTEKMLNLKEINNQNFRIGTSRLLGDLSKILTV